MSHFSEMTSRERWETALKHEKPDRLPMDYWATDEFTESILKYTGCPDIHSFYDRYHIDNIIKLVPRYTGPAISNDSDIFGCRYTLIDYGTGRYRECSYNPLAKYETIDEIVKNYTWPDENHFSYSHIPGVVDQNTEKPLMVYGWEPYLVYKFLRGEEQGYIDMIDNPELCHYIMGKLFNHFYSLARRVFEAADGKVLMGQCSEDLGSQTGLMYSPDFIREFFFPYHRKMIKMINDYGAKVYWHTDGAAREIIPDLIEIGVNLLNPIQWRCDGMDRERLMRDFGKNLVFHGTIDNQFTLPFGTINDVRNEVIENFRIFGEFGGYIMAPCHNIQPNTPPKNVVTMYDIGYNECKY